MTEWALAQNSLGVTVERSTEVAVRADFARLCHARGYIEAVEVGTDRGGFAREFMDLWVSGLTLWCVDPYESYPEMPWSRNADFLMAVSALSAHAARVRLCQMTSQEMAEFFIKLNISPEFVYIDAYHAYEAVQADLALWWPLVRWNGILAGHDFDLEHSGVRQAVLEFAAQIGQPIWLTSDTPESWYFYKTPPTKLHNCRSR